MNIYRHKWPLLLICPPPRNLTVQTAVHTEFCDGTPRGIFRMHHFLRREYSFLFWAWLQMCKYSAIVLGDTTVRFLILYDHNSRHVDSAFWWSGFGRWVGRSVGRRVSMRVDGWVGEWVGVDGWVWIGVCGWVGEKVCRYKGYPFERQNMRYFTNSSLWIPALHIWSSWCTYREVKTRNRRSTDVHR